MDLYTIVRFVVFVMWIIIWLIVSFSGGLTKLCNEVEWVFEKWHVFRKNVLGL